MRSWAAVLLVGLAGCGGSSLPELGDAAWLWPRGVSKAPAVLVLARDFDLEQAPERADLVVRAGDGFVAWVNGVRLAAVETKERCDLAVVDLGGRLRAGGNRVVLEVRFEGSAAGVIGCIRIDGVCRVPTDTQWWRPEQVGIEVVNGWTAEGPRGEGFEPLPGDLAARCLAAQPVADLGCHGMPVETEPHLTDDGGIETDLPAAGRLELAFPPRAEATKIRFRVDRHESDAVVAAGAPNYLDLQRRGPGPVAVSGAPVTAAWLWPWTPACGD